MQRTAQDWVVLTVLTDNDSLAVGLVTALQFAPMLVLMPYAGAVADRYDKRKVLVLTQIGQAVLGFGLGVLLLLNMATLSIVCVMALGLGIVSAFDSPVRMVFITSLVPPRTLPNAIGLNSMNFNIARLIGPAVAGYMVYWVGSGWVFVINGFSFLATLLSLALMKRDQNFVQARTDDEKSVASLNNPSSGPEPASETIQISQMTKQERRAHRKAQRKARRREGSVMDGFRYVQSRGDLKMIFALIGIISCLGMNFQLTTASMARVVFGREADGYGMLGSVMAVGSVAGALIAARRQEQPRVRYVVAMAFAFAVVSGLNAVMPTYPLYALSLIPVGLVMLTLSTSANTAVQMSTDAAVRGRVMALYQMVMMGTTPFGALIVGWLSNAVSPRWGVGIGSIGAFAIATIAIVWAHTRWSVEAELQLRRPFVRVIGPLEREQAAQAEEDEHQREALRHQEAARNMGKTIEETHR